MEERWSPSQYQVNKLFDHGYTQLTVDADAILEAGRNIPGKLRKLIEMKLEEIAESEMDLDYLGRQIVARFHHDSATSKAFHALREYDEEKVVIAYARKTLGLDQQDDRCKSPQREAVMEPPPIGTPLGKAQAIRLIKSNPKSNALKRDRQGKKIGYVIERPPMGGNQEMIWRNYRDLFVAELQTYGAFVAENPTDSTKIINAVAATWQGYWNQIIWRGTRPTSAKDFLRKLKRSAKGERDERAKRAKAESSGSNAQQLSALLAKRWKKAYESRTGDWEDHQSPEGEGEISDNETSCGYNSSSNSEDGDFQTQKHKRAKDMNYSRALENMPVADALVAGATIFNGEIEIDSVSTNVDRLGSACEAWQELSPTSHWYTLKECSSDCILRLKQPKEPGWKQRLWQKLFGTYADNVADTVWWPACVIWRKDLPVPLVAIQQQAERSSGDMDVHQQQDDAFGTSLGTTAAAFSSSSFGCLKQQSTALSAPVFTAPMPLDATGAGGYAGNVGIAPDL